MNLKNFGEELTSKLTKISEGKCPVNCGALHHLNDVEGISYCPACMGMWFDANALKIMLQNYPNKTESLVIVDAPNSIIGLLGLLGALFK